MSDAKKDAPEPAEGTPQPAAPADKRKKLILGGAGAVLLLAAGGGGWMAFGGSGDKTEEEATAEPEGDHASAEEGEGGEGGESFLDVPPMVVNLRSDDGAARFLKVHFMLVPGPKSSAESLKAKLPLLMDRYQPFLRELRPEDLAGSAAVFRVKEELLVRATEALGADQVKDVLIQDLIQQ